MEIRTERGGQGDVGRVNRQNIAVTNVGRPNNALADIAKSISGIVQSAYTINQREKVERDVEDKVVLQQKAQRESKDATKAMLGASYDTDLNTRVDSWRQEGLSDTIIRTNIQEYKYGKAIQEFGLDKGEKSDEAINSFFETFTDLELNVIKPIAEADNLKVQGEMKDVINSSFNVGTGSLQSRFKDSIEVAKRYNIPSEELMQSAIITAFRKAKNGDNTDLEALQTLKHKGVRVIDTVDGSKLYDKMLVTKEQREANDIVRKKAIVEQDQKDTTTNLYKEMINGDFEDSKVKIDASLEAKKISMLQHKTLTKVYDNLQPTEAENFIEESNPTRYLELRASAQLGTLDMDDLNKYRSELSYEDFKSIATLGLSKGGAFGIGNDANKLMDKDIDNFATDNAGLDLQNSISSDLEGWNLGRKRQSLIFNRLSAMKSQFVISNERLPEEEEYEKMKSKVLQYVDKSLGTISETGLAVAPTPTTFTEIMAKRPVDVAERRVWLKSLSPEQREVYKKGLQGAK